MSRITVPKTIKEAVVVLGGLEALVTAKEWERALIVHTFSSAPSSVREFAALKIAGLSTQGTVSAYRANWQAAINAGLAVKAKPGDRVELPDMAWPGRGDSTNATVRSAKAAMKDVDVAMTMLRNLSEAHPDLLIEVAEETPGWDYVKADEVEVEITPARVVDEIRNNPDVARAVSRHDDVVDIIEDHVTERRGSRAADDEERYKATDRRMTKNLSKALGIEEDQATHCLRMAATFIMNAVVACNEYGIEFPEAEQEAIKRIKRNLKVYEAQAPLNDADRTWAAENGIEVPQE